MPAYVALASPFVFLVIAVIALWKSPPHLIPDVLRALFGRK